MHRAICYPVVATRRCGTSWCVRTAVGSVGCIDYEENRTGGDKARAEEEAGNVFAMSVAIDCGTRRYRRLSGVLLERKEQILVHLRSIDLVWDKWRRRCSTTDHRNSAQEAMENMQRRSSDD